MLKEGEKIESIMFAVLKFQSRFLILFYTPTTCKNPLETSYIQFASLSSRPRRHTTLFAFVWRNKVISVAGTWEAKEELSLEHEF